LGLTIFLKAEADDLLECCDNNATRAYGRTSVYPLNPSAEAWTDAIDGLGAANPANKCETLSYEIVPAQEKLPVLNATENKLLRADLSIDAKNDLGNFYIAEIRATKILGKWRQHIEKGVSEGNNRAVYSAVHLPSLFATTDCEKLVMKLLNFKSSTFPTYHFRVENQKKREQTKLARRLLI
jgi:hypothetical protein